MNLPVTSYVVFLYNGDIGAHTPAFPDLDSAEEFANALRAATTNLVISEPCPVLATQELQFKARLKTKDASY